MPGAAAAGSAGVVLWAKAVPAAPPGVRASEGTNGSRMLLTMCTKEPPEEGPHAGRSPCSTRAELPFPLICARPQLIYVRDQVGLSSLCATRNPVWDVER